MGPCLRFSSQETGTTEGSGAANTGRGAATKSVLAAAVMTSARSEATSGRRIGNLRGVIEHDESTLPGVDWQGIAWTIMPSGLLSRRAMALPRRCRNGDRVSWRDLYHVRES